MTLVKEGTADATEGSDKSTAKTNQAGPRQQGVGSTPSAAAIQTGAQGSVSRATSSRGKDKQVVTNARGNVKGRQAAKGVDSGARKDWRQSLWASYVLIIAVECDVAYQASSHYGPKPWMLVAVVLFTAVVTIAYFSGGGNSDAN